MTRPSRMEIEPGVFRLPGAEHGLRILIRDRERALRELAEIDAQLLPLRKRYAAERGEFMLPTLERLKRELLR